MKKEKFLGKTISKKDADKDSKKKQKKNKIKQKLWKLKFIESQKMKL
jgi:hypothetical protein